MYKEIEVDGNLFYLERLLFSLDYFRFDDEIYKQFFNLMFFTGVRPGEAMALKFKDLNDGYINISKTLSSHGKREISTPKTFSSNRVIRIDKVLERDLLALKKLYKGQCAFKDNLYL